MGGLIIIGDEVDWSVGSVAFDWVMDLVQRRAQKTQDAAILELLAEVRSHYPFRHLDLSPNEIPDELYRRFAEFITDVALAPEIAKDQSFLNYLDDLKVMIQQDRRVADEYPHMQVGEKMKRERWRNQGPS